MVRPLDFYNHDAVLFTLRPRRERLREQPHYFNLRGRRASIDFVAFNKQSAFLKPLHLVFMTLIFKNIFSGKFFGKSCLFSMLWVLTNYMYIRALVALGSTEVISLFATNVSFVYLLSWVVLHEQFVGIRVSMYNIN
jgi:hypothetical protein